MRYKATLFVFWLVKCIACFFPLEFKSITTIRIFSPKMTFDVPFLTVWDYLLFFLEHFNKRFETTVTFTLDVE